jgi:hypothetical protein
MSLRNAGLAIALTLLAPLAAAQTAPLAASPPKTIVIDGFRSAHFGMDQAHTLQAIKADFNLSGKAVQNEINAVQQTASLSITVPVLVPNSGNAVINYVFGYKSKALAEVNITWSATDKTNSPAALLNTGAALQSYFRNEPFLPENMTGDTLLANGNLLLFRGIDTAGHEVMLVLAGPMQRNDKTKTTQMTPNVLTLLYDADAAHPDVFQLQPGSF